MKVDKLSLRLETVGNYVPPGVNLADIGSDHAYLPCNLVKKGTIPFAIAGEVVKGPFDSAKKKVDSEGLSDRISVRMGSGLEVIKPGEVDCITIAGMGGALIANILESGKDKLEHVERLVLQPNMSAISVREWLIANSWELIQEEILEEDGKIYEILVAEKGNPERVYGTKRDAGLLLGPFLMKKKGEAFRKKWSFEKANWERILKQLTHSASEGNDAIQKRDELLQKINMVEEVLTDEKSKWI